MSEDCENLNFGIPPTRFGTFARAVSPELLRTLPALPTKLPKKPLSLRPCQGIPKPILKPQSTQQTRITAKATNESIMLFTDQRFCITPP